MKKEFSDYTWLAGNHGSRGSLWQGPDHLLVVEGRGWILAFSEIYRRIDYKNVQALTITSTRTSIWVAVAMAVGSAIFALLAWAVRDYERIFLYSLGAPAVLLAILLIVHLVRGRSCVCTLQTAVQVLKLKPLGRLKKARPIMLKLETLCREHQSGLPATASATPPPAPGAFPAMSSNFPVSMAGAKPPWIGGTWMLGAGLLAVTWALFLGGELFVPSVAFTLAHLVVGVASGVFAIIALVRAYKFSVPGSLAAGLWGGLAAHVLGALAVFILAVASSAADAFGSGDPQAIIEANRRANENLFGALPHFHFDQTHGWGWGVLAISLILGFCGVIQLAYSPSRKAKGAGASPPPPSTPLPPAAPPPMPSA